MLLRSLPGENDLRRNPCDVRAHERCCLSASSAVWLNKPCAADPWSRSRAYHHALQSAKQTEETRARDRIQPRPIESTRNARLHFAFLMATGSSRQREFAGAHRGFKTAVTNRPGMISRER